jgi:hypothetical protein
MVEDEMDIRLREQKDGINCCWSGTVPEEMNGF